jgi:hypothetical protein
MPRSAPDSSRRSQGGLGRKLDLVVADGLSLPLCFGTSLGVFCRGGFYRSLLHGLVFECIESLLRGVPSKRFSGSIVEFVFDFEESFGAVNG